MHCTRGEDDHIMKRSQFEDVRVLGQGSFGVAVLTRPRQPEAGLGRTEFVVLKEIDVRRMSERERAEAMREATTLAQLDHENIIRYLGSFVERGHLHIALDYADGGDLAQVVHSAKRNRRSLSETQQAVVSANMQRYVVPSIATCASCIAI